MLFVAQTPSPFRGKLCVPVTDVDGWTVSQSYSLCPMAPSEVSNVKANLLILCNQDGRSEIIFTRFESFAIAIESK